MTDKGSACEKLCAEIRSSGVAPNVACGFWTHEAGAVTGGETDALFDLASVTKSFFAVACACARAGLRETMLRGVPLELMLAHRAGFPAHLPLFAPLRTIFVSNHSGDRLITGQLLPSRAIISRVLK